MFRKLDDFFITWKSERESTEKVFSALSNDILKQKTNENVRTLGRLAVTVKRTTPIKKSRLYQLEIFLPEIQAYE